MFKETIKWAFNYGEESAVIAAVGKDNVVHINSTHFFIIYYSRIMNFTNIIIYINNNDIIMNFIVNNGEKYLSNKR